jgi:choline monooxygenase
MTDGSFFENGHPVQRLISVEDDLLVARGLPNAAYTDRDFWLFERDHVLGKTWAALSFSSEIFESGVTVPVSFMGLPLFMVRDAEGGLRVFHNVCSHRGMQLVCETTETGLMIRCPYHRWGYDLKGQLKATPNIGGMGVHETAGFDCQQHGLKEVRSAEYLGIIFINLSGDAPPIETHLAPITHRWQALAGTDFAQCLVNDPSDIGVLELTVKCNYKLAVENYCESYHLPSIHPDLNRYSPLAQHYNLVVDDVASGQGTHTYDLERGQGPALPTFPHWDHEKLKTGEYLSLYPNVLLGLQADHFFAIILTSEAPDQTRERLQFSYAGTDALVDQTLARRQSLHRAWSQVFSEDISVVEGMQCGRASPGFDGGVFSPVMDIPTHHFHQWFGKRCQ